MQILIIEDELRLALMLSEWLISENFSVDIAHDGEEAIRKISDTYDLVILDRMLPKRSGIEVLRYIREEYPTLPVIILSALGEVDDRVDGLASWADDYLVKPFAFSELLARVHALIRRSTEQASSTLEVGSLILDTYRKRVSRMGTEIRLSSTELRLLEYMMRYSGHILSESRLLEHVWDHNYDGLSNVVSVYIGYLRTKIDKAFPTEPPLIHTVRGLGYKIDTLP